MVSMGKTPTDVSEIFSPPRVTAMAPEMGMAPGFAIDLTVPKPDGQPWDLSKEGDIKMVEKMIDVQKPFLLVGSPPCTWGARFNISVNYPRLDEAEAERRKQAGRAHLQTAIRLLNTRTAT